MELPGGVEEFECALVRWYQPAASHRGCGFLGQRFEWQAAEKDRAGYGVVALRRLLGPAFMQADQLVEVKGSSFYFNPYALENQAFFGSDGRFVKG